MITCGFSESRIYVAALCAVSSPHGAIGQCDHVCGGAVHTFLPCPVQSTLRFSGLNAAGSSSGAREVTYAAHKTRLPMRLTGQRDPFAAGRQCAPHPHARARSGGRQVSRCGSSRGAWLRGLLWWKSTHDQGPDQTALCFAPRRLVFCSVSKLTSPRVCELRPWHQSLSLLGCCVALPSFLSRASLRFSVLVLSAVADLLTPGQARCRRHAASSRPSLCLENVAYTRIARSQDRRSWRRLRASHRPDSGAPSSILHVATSSAVGAGQSGRNNELTAG